MGQYSSPGTELNAQGKTAKTSSRLTVILTAAVAALGGAIFGYDTSVISGAMLFLRTDFHLSDVQLEFAVGDRAGRGAGGGGAGGLLHGPLGPALDAADHGVWASAYFPS